MLRKWIIAACVIFLLPVAVILYLSDSETVEPAGWTIFWGRFHPLLVHLPIGFLLVGAIVALIDRRRPLSKRTFAAGYLLMAGSFFALLSVMTGFLLSLSGDYDEDLLNAHFWFGISLTCLSGCGTLVYVYSKNSPRKISSAASDVFMAAILFTLMMTGHYGGSLTHGSDYITENMSSGFKKILGIREVQKIQPQKITTIEDAVLFRDIIYPMLSGKCVSCHNKGKKKGRLMLDSEEGILQGGKSGKCITPGSPEGSELYTRIILPEGDRERMPPEGKTGLDEDQTELLRRWILDSASFTKTVAELKLNDSVRALALKVAGVKDAGVFGRQLPMADSAAEAALRQAGVSVRHIMAGRPFLDVDFINHAEITAEQCGLLLALKQQVVWMKATNMHISDTALAAISQMENLAVLRVDNTDCSDASLRYFSNLKNLETLNLYGTGVKGDSIHYLSELKKLKKLFLGKTPAGSSAIQKLKVAHPAVTIIQ